MQNEPLLFVQGPPVFIHMVIEEESTSVFEMESTPANQEKTVENTKESALGRSETEVEKTTEQFVFHPNTMMKKLQYLATPFPKQAYKPLHFVLEKEIIKGAIDELHDQNVIIQLDGEKINTFVSIDINDIREVLWRGTPFEI